MDFGSVLGLYILTSSVTCLIINILFFRLVFRKQKRMKANGYSWISSLGIMALANFGFVFAFVSSITGVSNVLEAGIIFLFVIPSITWFVPASLYTLIRAIYIVITKSREREILSQDIETAEVVTNDLENSDT
ncbi:MAG: hypothetical protein KGD59_04320 [Candidatus Heimdallarchaeota archaeon]|nr:hypothetical protein [Candidatus Heimdallarchaeota archaeon]MBY8993751.1 hypothetical protein [Candidatus Heimdallarchaeota archaeon]